ncbi:hypothetical protein LCGC14_0679800 [marine sediment metagenome]|uniref:Uncharacterized protein n=1 Tax=marine sediment metagenome TaxID=412755 RepID=A0A0F9R8S7_9ZZZZ
MPTQLQAAFEVDPLNTAVPLPIQELMYAMVESGIVDLVKMNTVRGGEEKERKHSNDYNTSRFWFFGDFDDYVLGFPRICEHFGVDVGSARKAIKKLYRVRF